VSNAKRAPQAERRKAGRVRGISVASQTRVKQPRTGWLRAFAATLRSGVLQLTGGAWIKRAGTDEERKWDAKLRAWLNLGDRVVVVGSDACALELVGIQNPGFAEAWRTKVIYGACADGSVVVMPMKRGRR